MRKFFKASLVAALAATTLAGCGSDDSSSKKEECPIRVGFVTDVGGIDDKSFNQGSWEGIIKWAEENKLPTENGKCIGYVQSKAEADYVPNLSGLAEDGYDLVIAAGFLFDNAIGEVSPKYPDTKFFVIDTEVVQPNIESGIFKAEQSSYLAGVAGAMQAKAEGGDTIGFIGGMETAPIQAFQAGYEQGAKAVDPEIKIMIDYAGGFDKPDIGQTLAEKQYNAGAKVIYHAAGGTGSGVIKVAKERATAGEKVWILGVDRDQYEDGKYDGEKSVVLTSALKRVDVATFNASQSVQDGTYKGGTTINFDINNEGVGIPAKNPNLTEDIKTKIDQAIQEIKDGKIEVTATPTIKNGSVG